jgi:hypothetical protein
MLIFDSENWPRHRPWAYTATLVASAAIVWYGFYGFLGHQGKWHWPGGSSPPGFTFGILGGLIILFEMLLVPRKYLWRGRRFGRTQYWMMAHIWLGLIVLVLLVLHGDFHFSLGRSTLAAVLMWLLVAVIVSGILGVVVQTILPRILLESVPSETIYSQIDHVVDHYRNEAERLVKAICGPELSALAGEQSDENSPTQEYQLVGMMQKVGNLQGKILRTEAATLRVPGSEPLIDFHTRYIRPYLSAGSQRGLELESPRKATALFASLKLRLPSEAFPTVDRLAELCDRKRQLNLQASLHRWLFTWLAFHVGLSSALVVLMFVHIALSMKYL